jgi:hypothetical protein
MALIISIVLPLVLPQPSESEAWIKKTVDGWTWFEDYIGCTLDFTVTAPANRRVLVGTGVFSGGEPRGDRTPVENGETKKLSGTLLGAVHIKKDDQKDGAIDVTYHSIGCH